MSNGNDPSIDLDAVPLTCEFCGEGFYDERDVSEGGNVVWINGYSYHADCVHESELNDLSSP